MSERKMIFRAGREELMLPVTPAQYRMEHGINVEVVNIHQLGDVNLAGNRTLATVQIDCMFPAKDYRFARDSDPQRYIDRLEKWTKNKTALDCQRHGYQPAGDRRAFFFWRTGRHK